MRRALAMAGWNVLGGVLQGLAVAIGAIGGTLMLLSQECAEARIRVSMRSRPVQPNVASSKAVN